MTRGTSEKGPQHNKKKRLTHCGPGPRCSLTSFPGRLVFFFFAAAPRGRSLTHCGPGRGGVFFFAVAPHGRSLTHCGLGRFRQGRGVVCFLLRPRRTRRAKNKMSGVLHIGSKKTRRGHSKKKDFPRKILNRIY